MPGKVQMINFDKLASAAKSFINLSNWHILGKQRSLTFSENLVPKELV